VFSKLAAILTLIFTYSAFLNKSRSSTSLSGITISKDDLIARWSKPCSVKWMAHFIVSAAISADARTRSIVVSLRGPYYVLVPRGNTEQRRCSFIKSIIRSTSP
jgi:hypothetical protein